VQKELRRCVVVTLLGPVFYVTDVDAAEEQARLLACSLAGKRFTQGRPVVGDWVQVAVEGEDQGVIVGIEARTSLIERQAPSGRGRKPLVANLDRLVVVASAQQPPLKPGLIDRYLVAAHQQRISALICVNKWELADEDDLEIAATYAALGYDLCRVSARTGEGLEALLQLLSGHRSAFLGHSGVGKSSILNCLLPNACLAVGDLSVQSGRGRHTTTHSSLLRLPGGGFVIDTPGIREFGLTNIASDEIVGAFPEIVKHAQSCRFQPCTHTHEPECAVHQAVEDGEIPAERYYSYARLFDELAMDEAERFR